MKHLLLQKLSIIAIKINMIPYLSSISLQDKQNETAPKWNENSEFCNFLSEMYHLEW